MSKCEKKLRIAVVCEANPAKNPRPNRVIRAFKDECIITAIGRGASEIEGVEVLSYDPPCARTRLEEWRLYLNVFTRNYRPLIYIPTRLKIVEYLKEREFDVIFCHDLILLPLVLESKKGAKVIFDAREYYPREMEHNLRWRILFAKFNDWLCRTFMPKADYCYTVSEGIAHEYEKNYNIKCDVVMSLPDISMLKLRNISGGGGDYSEKIRLIHHGVANEDRGIEGMIEMMDYTNSRFSLDLMLVPTNQSEYFQKLRMMAQSRPNVRIIPPVAFEEIIPFISQYDIGLYILKPSGFNTTFALPNKFFEYIQAHLALAIAPSPEMARIVAREGNGIISDDFSPQSMAKALNNLSAKDIERFKSRSKAVAPQYHAKKNREKLSAILCKVLNEENR